MNKLIKNIFLILILNILIIVSCTQNKSPFGSSSKFSGSSGMFGFGRKELSPVELKPAEYARWIENKENGLYIIQQQGQYIYELQYQPVEYSVIMQERKEELPASLLKEEIKKRGDLQYYTFKMSNINGMGICSNKELNIDKKEIYLLSGMQNDFKIIEKGDTINCAMFHFETANNLIPYDLCVLAFEKVNKKIEDKIFLFRTDKYKKGWVKMEIKAENIKKIPKIKTI